MWSYWNRFEFSLKNYAECYLLHERICILIKIRFQYHDLEINMLKLGRSENKQFYYPQPNFKKGSFDRILNAGLHTLNLLFEIIKIRILVKSICIYLKHIFVSKRKIYAAFFNIIEVYIWTYGMVLILINRGSITENTIGL